VVAFCTPCALPFPPSRKATPLSFSPERPGSRWPVPALEYSCFPPWLLYDVPIGPGVVVSGNFLLERPPNPWMPICNGIVFLRLITPSCTQHFLIQDPPDEGAVHRICHRSHWFPLLRRGMPPLALPLSIRPMWPNAASSSIARSGEPLPHRFHLQKFHCNYYEPRRSA